MNESSRHIHPITLVALAIVVGVGLNFVIWLAAFGKPPTVAQFHDGREGIGLRCFTQRMERGVEFAPELLNNWIENNICVHAVLILSIAEIMRFPECGLTPLRRRFAEDQAIRFEGHAEGACGAVGS